MQEPLAPTGDDLFTGYLSMRDQGSAHDMRILFATYLEKLDFSSASVTIEFEKSGATVNTFALQLGGKENDFTAYQTVVAAGERFFADDGCVLFGVIITDIPDGAWDSLTVTITDNASPEAPLYQGTVNHP